MWPHQVLRVLLVGLALALCAPGAAADEAVSEEARKHFKAGVSYLEDPEGARYEEAYAEFKKAYEISKSPKVLGNVGLCAMKLERDGEAIQAYQRYLSEVPDIDPDERAQIEQDLPTITASAAHIRITLTLKSKRNRGAIVLTDLRVPVRGANVVNVYTAGPGLTELAIRPGHHSISVSVGGEKRGAWDFNATPGTKLSHAFVVDDPPTAPRPRAQPAPSRTGPLLLMGVGAAALVAGGVVGIVALKKTQDLDDKCPNDTCTAASYKDDVDDVRGYVRTTDFLLLGGGILTAAGLGWLILSPGSGPSEHGDSRGALGTEAKRGRPRANADRAALQAGIACGTTACMTTMRARF